MKHAEEPASPIQAPFERFADFVRRIIAVPKSEIMKKAPPNKQRKPAARQRETA